MRRKLGPPDLGPAISLKRSTDWYHIPTIVPGRHREGVITGETSDWRLVTLAKLGELLWPIKARTDKEPFSGGMQFGYEEVWASTLIDGVIETLAAGVTNLVERRAAWPLKLAWNVPAREFT